jgi:arsenical pump membrane protein
MPNSLLALLIFVISVVLTIVFILKKPQINIILKTRTFHVDTFFIGPLIGFLIIILVNVLSFQQLIQGILGQGTLNPIGILILFLSMVLISIFLDTTGFFELCARLALKFAGRSGVRLFLLFYAIISFLTVFTSNDIIILTFTPFIYYYSKAAKIDPKPYLIAEFFAANTWSMSLYIGNPTNILLASAFSMKFDTYLSWMALPTLAAGMVGLLLLYFVFKKEINKPVAYDDQVKPLDAIQDKLGAIIGLVSLGTCIILLILAPYLEIEMWIVALFCALSLTVTIFTRDLILFLLNKNEQGRIHFRLKKSFSKMPWAIIPFVLSLFVLVEALKVSGITQNIGSYLRLWSSNSSTIYTFLFGYLSAISANLLNNIPMSVAFVPIITEASLSGAEPALFATIIGSNLGANLTPLGALAGIMWMSILKNKGYDFNFWHFLKYGLIITPLTIFSCLGVLSIEFLLL